MMAALDNNNGVSLKYLLKGIAEVTDQQERLVTGISNDSRTVGRDYLFTACNCNYNRSIEFTRDAVHKGANVVLYESGNDRDMEGINSLKIAVRDLHKKLGVISDRFFGSPTQDMNIIGVTGTNGKTTVSHLITQALTREDDTCGLIGTLGYGTLDNLRYSANTTPMPPTLQHYLADFHDAGIKKAVLEISSHGLDQYRIVGTRITTAVFTNLTRDHLDYHANLESYAGAKRKLFTEYSILNAVININDIQGSNLIREMDKEVRIIKYGMSQSRIQAEDKLEYIYGKIAGQDVKALDLDLETSWGNGSVRVGLTGEFNAYNILACLAVLMLNDFSFDEALKRLSLLQPVPGRMESITCSNKATIFVDYAHTPDALIKALKTARSGNSGRLICIFGCGGDRDTGKRPLMGEAAAKYADIIIVTSDNPRSEDPEQIIKHIVKGISGHIDTRILPDRQQAICEAINESQPNDVILIAGKGHEDYQEINGSKIPFSDQEIVKQLMGVNHD